MNTCETGRHLQTSCTNCSQQKVLHALLTVPVNQTSSYGTGPVRATCYTRRKIKRIFRREMRGLGRVRVFISGLNFQGLAGSTSSSCVKRVHQARNGARSGFEGAKAACEQQAVSTAASSFAPEPARSGRLTRSLSMISTLICLLRYLTLLTAFH
jgi:hypothetical protein